MCQSCTSWLSCGKASFPASGKADGLQAATGLEHGQAAPSVMALNMSGPILKASAGTAWFAAMEKKVLAGDAASQATPGSMLFVWGRRAQSQTRGAEVPAGQHGEPLQKPCRSHLPSQHGGTQSCLLEIDCRSAATASDRRRQTGTGIRDIGRNQASASRGAAQYATLVHALDGVVLGSLKVSLKCGISGSAEIPQPLPEARPERRQRSAGWSMHPA